MTYAKAFVNICMICLFNYIVSYNKDKVINIVNEKFLKSSPFFSSSLLFAHYLMALFEDFAESRKIAQIILLFILFSFVNDKRFLIYGFVTGVLVSSLITDLTFLSTT